MDSRLRGNDEVVGYGLLGFVIPVQTGIHAFRALLILAQAGVADVFMLPSHDNAGYSVLKGIGHDIHQQAHISCPPSFTGSRI